MKLILETLALVAVSAWVTVRPNLSTGQIRNTPATLSSDIQRVEAFSDLEPRTPAEEARAAFFDLYNLSQGKRQTLLEKWSPDYGLAGGIPSDERAVVDISQINLTPEQALRARVCGADALVLGRIRSRRALLTKSKMLLFTDFTVTVDRWFRPAGDRRAEIVSSSVGGRVLLAGKPLAVGVAVERFQVDGPAVYLLKWVPSNESYSFMEEPVLRAAQDSPNDGYLDRLLRVASTC